MSAAAPTFDRIIGNPDSRGHASASGSQLATDAAVVAVGSELDVRGLIYGSMSLIATVFGVTAQLFAANRSDYADEIMLGAGFAVVVGTPTMWSGGTSYQTAVNGTVISYAYLRLKILNTVGGSAGTLAWNFSGKNS